MDAKTLCATEAAQTYMAMLSRRAFQEGYAAFMAGKDCSVPTRLGTYSGQWVEGWQTAALDNETAPAAQKAVAASDSAQALLVGRGFVAPSQLRVSVN